VRVCQNIGEVTWTVDINIHDVISPPINMFWFPAFCFLSFSSTVNLIWKLGHYAVDERTWLCKRRKLSYIILSTDYAYHFLLLRHKYLHVGGFVS
jgi:hypothetical protein